MADALRASTAIEEKGQIARRLKFGVGSLSNGIMSVTPGLILLYYLTTFVHMPPALAGLVIVVPRAVAIFADPLIGHLSDRLKAKSELHRRGLMLLGAFSVAGGLSLLFILPPRVPHGGWVAAALYFWAALGFSFFAVPNAGLPADIETSADRRRGLVATRMVFGMTGGIVGAVAGPMIVDVAGYGAMGVTLGFLGGAAITICALTYSRSQPTSVEREVPKDAPTKNPPGQKLSLAGLADPRYLIALGGFVLLVVAHSVSNAALPFLVQGLFKQSSAEFGKLFFLSIGTGTVATILWPFLLKRIGYRWAWRVAAALMVIGGGFVALAGAPNGIFQAGLILGGFGYPAVQIVGYITLANVASRAEAEGRAGSGMMAGFWSASDKLANNVGPLIVGIILQIAAAPGGSLKTALIIAIGVLPAALAASGVLVLARHRDH